MTITRTKAGRTTIYSHPELGPVARVAKPGIDSNETEVWLAVGPDDWINIDSRNPHGDALDHAKSL